MHGLKQSLFCTKQTILTIIFFRRHHFDALSKLRQFTATKRRAVHKQTVLDPLLRRLQIKRVQRRKKINFYYPFFICRIFQVNRKKHAKIADLMIKNGSKNLNNCKMGGQFFEAKKSWSFWSKIFKNFKHRLSIEISIENN